VCASKCHDKQANSSQKTKETKEGTKRELLPLAALIPALVAAGKTVALGGISSTYSGLRCEKRFESCLA